MCTHLIPGRVKICGLTSLPDAQAAVACGARTLGFVFHAASPRAVSPALVREIVNALPADIACVGVFVNHPPHVVQSIVESCRLTAVQWHGDEPDAWLAAVSAPAIKAVRLRSAADIARLTEYPSAAAFLVDAWSPHVAGGSGRTWDWSLATSLPALGRPLILAGGLTPENVAQAISQVKPAAVDVSSGVEAVPGRKDYDKLRRFVAIAQEVFDEQGNT